MATDPAPPPDDTQTGPSERPGPLHRAVAPLVKGVRHVAVYFGLLAVAGGGLVLVGQVMRLLGLSSSATHIARFAMLGLYVAAAVAMARGRR